MQAEDGSANSRNALPELGLPNERPGTITPNAQGVILDNRFDGKRLVVSPEYSDQNGLSLGGAFAFPLGENSAGGLLLSAGAEKNSLLFNAGFQMSEAQRLVFSLGQQRQSLNFGFASGWEKTAMTQNSVAASYQFRLARGLLDSAEVNAYLSNTPSRDLADKTYAVDTAALYELWNDPRRVAGGSITGLQARLAFTPAPGGTLKLGAGGEQQEFDHLTGKQRTTRATGSAEWRQQLAGDYQLNAGIDAAIQNRYTLGLAHPFGAGWLFGVNLVGIRGRDGAPDDNQIKLTWSYDFSGRRASSASVGNTRTDGDNAAPAWGSLLDQVVQRLGFLPSQVVAKLDTTAAPVRQIAVNKAALPAGASVNTATGVVTNPLGVAVTGIAGVTLNGAAFANTGQFSLAGNNLAIDPGKITQPAVGVIDTYVVTVNNLGGGTTLVTVVVSRGSVQIDSITVSNGVADVIAPNTTAAPAVSGTTDTATTLTVTLNENGTGYYLVQPAAAAVPTVAAVQAGTAFAMTANVAATQAISGLTASTAYTVYFVAKDAANNVQAAVQSVAVTTTATVDVTAPVATADSTTTLFNTVKTAINVLANDTDNSGAVPTLTGVLSNQVGGVFTVNAGKIDFTPTTGFSGAASVTYEITDASNNTSTGVLTVTVGSDVTVPVATADSTTTLFNTAKTAINVLANDTDNSGAAPTLTGVLSNQVGGVFTVNAGKIDFTPTAGFSGAASVTYEITDASNNKSTGVLTVTVGADVTVPVATADSTTTLFNTAKTAINVLANDTDNSGAVPTLTGVLSNQVGGVFTVNAGKINFTPTTGFSGAASVTYEIADASNNTSTGVLTVTVGADVTVPVAIADSTTTLFNTAKTAINVLANDTDNSGAAPTLTGVLSNQVGGVFTVNAGKIDFTPTTGFSGAASVTYEITDASNNKSTGVLTVTVGADITVPVATADSTTTLFNTAKTAINVLANDTDNSGAAPTLTGVMSNQVGGVFTVNAGKIDFTPTTGFSGAASVTYEITDASNNKSTGVLTVTVGADVTVPVATADSTTTLFNTAKTAINVLANDTDNSGAAPTLTGVLSNQVGGVFTVNAGKIDFTPTAGFSGAASVTYEITDASNNKSTGVLTVTVGSDVTVPVATADSTTTLFNTAKTAINVLANDTDNSGVAPTLTGVLSNQVGGVFTVNAGKIDFTPTAGFSGAASVTYEIADASNNTSTGVLTVTVGADVTVPVATADSTTTLFNTAKTAINVLANDTDNSGAAPTLTGVLSNQVGGVFTVNAGKIDFTPTAGFSGAASVTYEITDASNNTSTGVLTVTVGGDTTAPTTSAGPSVSGTTDTATTLSATINENGTGYYLVQAAAAAAPSVATVQASGTSFAMTANVAATPAIGGLTAGTAYTVYFVAKDAANNVQAAVQSVAVTTNALPTANNFTYGTNIDNTAKTFDWKVLSAAADADGDTLTATVQAQGAKGTFVVAGNNVTYTPSANQTVSDSGTLRISDGRGGVKDITVTVNGIDTAPPAAPSGLALDAGAASTTAASVALNNFTDPADADLAAWFVSESGSAPVAGDAGWSSTKPTTYTFATATNETKTVCVYVKDTLGNVQPTGACDTIAKVAAAAAPTASNVAITGTTQAGQTLTGSYSYADANSDAQGATTFRWLRGGVAIAGATASTYTLVVADVGSTITFEVTPVATVAPTTGTPVVSAATAAVTLPAGYVSQGGLTWTPNTIGSASFGGDYNGFGIPGGYASVSVADAYCAGTSILGQTGWRLPTIAELSALYASGAMNGQGWTLDNTWSSVSHGVGFQEFVDLRNGQFNWTNDTSGLYVTCVR